MYINYISIGYYIEYTLYVLNKYMNNDYLLLTLVNIGM